MSLLMQIAIPLIGMSILLVAIAIWRRYIRPETVVLVGLALVLGVGSLVAAIMTANPGENAAKQQTRVNRVSLILAEQHILNGRYALAAEVLDELDCISGDDDHVVLTQARLAVLTDDYASALPLYKLANQTGDEMKTVQRLVAGTAEGSDNAIVAYLTNHGHDPAEYGMEFADVTTGDIDRDSLKADIIDAVEDNMSDYRDTYGDDVVDSVESAANIVAEFHALVTYGYADLQLIEDCLDVLEDGMDASVDIESNAHIRDAMMKAYIALGDYQGYANTACEYTTDEELIILTELFVSGMIDGDDFPESYVYIDSEQVEELIEHCRCVLADHKAALTAEQYQRYRERLDKFADDVENPVLFVLRSNLSSGAYGGAERLRSKLFLSLAKLEFSQNNTEEAESYIADALGISASSDDENYRRPMMRVSAIIQGVSDSEDIKNVAVYVDAALNHSVGEDFTADFVESMYVPDDEEYPDDSLPEESFAEHMQDQVVKATAMLNIGVINKADFPAVQARVQIQSQTWTSVEEIKNHLLVYDCGSPITEFSLEKLEFNRARIVLLCDISGSMSGNEAALKDAIVAFSQNMTDGEYVSVIGFNDGIVFQEPFSDNPAVVASYADKVRTGGGTALYSAVLDTLDQFTPDINSNDIIIAMTDGQDGDSASAADMHNILGAKAGDKGVTVYTMGLGDSVDTDYLITMADSGNGSFLYAENAEKMNTFYDFIHGQLANQYILSYTAKNQTMNKRPLKLSMVDELGNAEKYYYLQEPAYGETDSDSYDPYIATDSELSVYGFSTKFLYKSSVAQELQLKGNGFDEGDDVFITLTDSVQYNLTAAFVDANTYTVSIPAEISTGVYELTVTIRGESFTLENELTVAIHGTQKTFTFGDYRFTALKSSIADNGDTILSGNVTMNGWLMFKGDVTIIGDYTNAERVTIRDDAGCTIAYQTGTAMGLAGYMAEQGVPLSIDKLGEFEIYNTPYTAREYKDFPVDTVIRDSALNSINALFLIFENGSYSVYPDMIKFQGFNLHYNLPFQKQLMRNFDVKGYKLDIDTEVIFGANQIALMGEVKYEDIRDEEFIMVSLPLNLSKFSAEFDTLRNDYSVEAKVGLKALKAVDGFVFNFEILDGKFDAIGLQIETADGVGEVTIVAAPVPITMKDFGFEISGFSKESGDNLLSKILSKTFTAKFKVNVASLNAYAPQITKLIDKDDIALATLDNCELSLCLKEFRIAFEADVVLATVLKIGKCEIELGKFDYTNALIGYYNETECGLRAKLTAGSKWETTNLSMELTGAVELTLGYPYSGLWLNGSLDFEVGWWILRADFDVAGDAMIGAYQNSSGNFQFSIIVRGTDSGGEYSGFHLYITKATGFDIISF